VLDEGPLRCSHLRQEGKQSMFLLIHQCLNTQQCSVALLQAQPSSHTAVLRAVCPCWPGSSSWFPPASLQCSLRDPELVELLCRARELWCPGTPVWPCAAQAGRQSQLDAISTTESISICPAGSTAPLQSTYLLVGSSGSPVPLDQWPVIT